jgi:hypothetical protein
VAEEDGWTIAEEYAARERVGWHAPAELPALGANDEIQQWVAKAMQAVGGSGSQNG